MNKPLYILALLMMTQWAVAQSLSPTVVASAGRHAEAGGFMLSYTVGEETAVKTAAAGNRVLTQGFHQPNDGVTGVTELTLPNMDIRLYPNPATEFVTVWVQCRANTGCANLRVTLHDLLGREIKIATQFKTQGNEVQHAFNLTTLAASVYFVRVRDESANTAKTIKFTKTSL